METKDRYKLTKEFEQMIDDANRLDKPEAQKFFAETMTTLQRNHRIAYGEDVKADEGSAPGKPESKKILEKATADAKAITDKAAIDAKAIADEATNHGIQALDNAQKEAEAIIAKAQEEATAILAAANEPKK